MSAPQVKIRRASISARLPLLSPRKHSPKRTSGSPPVGRVAEPRVELFSSSISVRLTVECGGGQITELLNSHSNINDLKARLLTKLNKMDQLGNFAIAKTSNLRKRKNLQRKRRQLARTHQKLASRILTCVELEDSVSLGKVISKELYLVRTRNFSGPTTNIIMMEEKKRGRRKKQASDGTQPLVPCILLLTAAPHHRCISRNCMSVDCGSKFSIYKRKHHCRFCGRVFCSKCSAYQILSNRSCASCYDSFAQDCIAIEPRDEEEMPPFIQHCLEYLHRPEILTVYSLFKIPGEPAELEMLQDAFDVDHMLSLEKLSPHSVAFFVKRYISNQGPLLTEQRYADFFQTFGQPAGILRDNEIVSLVNKLPPLNLSMLWGLLDLLVAVATNSTQNKMTVAALAHEFTPSLLKPPTTREFESAQARAAEAETAKRIVEHLINLRLANLESTSGIGLGPDYNMFGGYDSDEAMLSSDSEEGRTRRLQAVTPPDTPSSMRKRPAGIDGSAPPSPRKKSDGPTAAGGEVGSKSGTSKKKAKRKLEKYNWLSLVQSPVDKSRPARPSSFKLFVEVPAYFLLLAIVLYLVGILPAL